MTQGLEVFDADLAQKFIPNHSSQVFLGCVVPLDDVASYYFSYEKLPIFFDILSSQTRVRGHYKCLCYFFNLAYDGDYILKWLLQHNYHQTFKIDPITMLPVLNHHEFNMMKTNSAFYRLCFCWKRVKIFFIDAQKLFPTMSIRAMGDLLGYPKLSELVNYSEFCLNMSYEKLELVKTYCHRDTEILAIYLNNFFAHEKQSNAVKRQTIGSISYSYLKALVKEKNPVFTLTDFYFWEKWYRGGRCDCNREVWGKWIIAPKSIYVDDGTSFYPSQMIKRLPFGKPLDQPPEMGTYCTFYEIKIIHAKVKKKFKDFPMLYRPYVYQGEKRMATFFSPSSIYQYLDEVKDSIYYFIDIEWERILKTYNVKYEIVKRYYFQTDDYLSEITKKLFLRKKNASNKILRTFAKVLINSTYGKLGQKPHQVSDYFGTLENLDSSYEVLSKKSSDQLYESYNVRKKLDPSCPSQPVFVAAYITAAARCDLFDRYWYIKKHGGTFLYCDSDSIFFIKNKDFVLPNEGGDLGQWELEDFGAADAFCCLCPKHYRIIKNKSVIKEAHGGIGRKAIAKVPNEDYNYDMGEKYHLNKTMLKNSYNGKVIFDSPYDFRKWKKYYKNPRVSFETLKWIKNFELITKEEAEWGRNH